MINDYELAQYAQQAYKCKTFRVNELETLVIEHNDSIVVSVRGTEISRDLSLVDIIRDLRFLPFPERNTGIAHAGIVRGAERVTRALHRHLDHNRHGRSVYLTGHSLGAGVSLLMVPQLVARGYNVVKWVGLGTPLVLWNPLRSWRTENTLMHAYRYGRDIITYLPPKWLGYELPPGVRLIKIGKPARRWPNISDHWVEQYVREIECREYEYISQIPLT